MPNRRDLRRTNPNCIVYFALRVLAANFKTTSFFMVNIVVTIIRNFNHGLNRRSRELTIQGPVVRRPVSALVSFSSVQRHFLG